MKTHLRSEYVNGQGEILVEVNLHPRKDAPPEPREAGALAISPAGNLVRLRPRIRTLKDDWRWATYDDVAEAKRAESERKQREARRDDGDDERDDVEEQPQPANEQPPTDTDSNAAA